ncbi:bacteriohopanetetrol glucosamine biosynthesis glycosyltransferase HpnI [Cupriavidus sp. 2TAF22]|uniref:bacteriohopanetetrol glucosamine biosynthesis glycosyltransferase HpnI n=1 Tax=unclassified Cupriavidus TaxID=2640874 RepID=UPI003F8F9FC2
MTLCAFAGPVVAWIGAAYAVAAAWISRHGTPASHASPDGVDLQPVSVLKPLCGAEPRLFENLATLCQQDYPDYQIVFGVQRPDDPALDVVERLRADYPARAIDVVVDSRIHGTNLKVSNLINLWPSAHHDWLVLADSDIAVGPDYLARVAAPLANPAVGVVTCLYHGNAVAGFWSRIGARFIDDWFAPSVRVAHRGGSRRFSFGATIALRRDALERVGGFAALSNRLADDFWLGELVRRSGLRTVLSDVVVSTDVTETSMRAWWTHELRWMRTIRSLNPVGFAFTFLTFTWPMLLLGCWLSPRPVTLTALLVGALARSVVAHEAGAALLAPLRDALLLAVWCAAMAGSRVCWRDRWLPLHDTPTPRRGATSVPSGSLRAEPAANGLPDSQSPLIRSDRHPPRSL